MKKWGYWALVSCFSSHWIELLLITELANLFTCIWMDVMVVWCTPNILQVLEANWFQASWNGCPGGFRCCSGLRPLARSVLAGWFTTHRQTYGCLSSPKPERIMGNRARAFDALQPHNPPCSLLILPSAICEKEHFHAGQMERSSQGREHRALVSSFKIMLLHYGFVLSCEKRCHEIGLYFRCEMIVLSHLFSMYFIVTLDSHRSTLPSTFSHSRKEDF